MEEKMDLLSIEAIPLPNEIPKLVDSTSIETLIAQNADLVSRLHVSLRRLSTLEIENSSIKNQNMDLEKKNQVIQDQVLVWKHKEQLWINKIQSLEQFQADSHLQFSKLEGELKGLRAVYENNERELVRYKKYHDKIKTHIKPYIQQLKQFAHSLKREVNGLLRQLENRDVRLNLMEKKVSDLRRELEEQFHQMDRNHSQAVLRFEQDQQIHFAEMDQLRQSLLEKEQALSEKIQSLDYSNERRDMIENQFIALQRLKLENELKMENQIHNLKSEVMELKKQLVSERLNKDELYKTNEDMKKILDHAEKSLTEREVQLSKVRFLWSNKTEEVERLKSSNMILEQNNLELMDELNKKKGEQFI